MVERVEDVTQSNGIRHPFDESALFIERDDGVGTDVCLVQGNA